MIDCWVASLVAELDAMSSSSLIPVTVAPSPAMLTELNLPVDADVAPIGVPSIVPALMSTLLEVSGEIAKVTQALLASFLIFRTLFAVSNHKRPAEIAVAGADAPV